MLHKLLRRWGHFRALPFGLRDRVLRLLYPVGTDFSFEVPFFGHVYPGNTQSYLDWCVFFYGAYELPLLTLIGAILKKMDRPVVLDIGANVGQHTLYMSSFASHIHAFEPHPDFCRAIAHKVTLNRLSNVSIHNLGLGDNNATLQYFAPAGHQFNKGTGSFVEGYNTDLEPFEYLQVKKGDDYIDSLDLARIDFIKIDVEGLEMEVLTGLQKSLQAFRPVIIMEFSEKTARKIGTSDRLRALFPTGYTIRLVNPEAGGKLKDFDFDAGRGDIIGYDSGIHFPDDL